MSQATATYWLKYSDYVLCQEADGAQYVKPAAGAIALTYAPSQRRDGFILSMLAQLERAAVGREAADVIALEFVKKFGLLGIGLTADGAADCCFGGDTASLRSVFTGRGPEYNPVFSSGYEEKCEAIAVKLKEIWSVYNDGVQLVDMQDTSSLYHLTAAYLQQIVSGGTLHQCAYCHKFYYTDDPNSRTCDDGCEFALQIDENINEIKTKYPCDVLLRG